MADNTELTCKMRPEAVGGGIGAELAHRKLRDKATVSSNVMLCSNQHADMNDVYADTL